MPSPSRGGDDIVRSLWKHRAVLKNGVHLASVLEQLLIYGGGAKTISNQTGASVSLVQKLIDSFYARYPGVKKWQEDMQKLVEANSEWKGHTSGGKAAKRSQLVSPLGRVWEFVQEEPPWGGNPTFCPTYIKNYPVQGFATGDIVPLAVAEVAKWLMGWNEPGSAEVAKWLMGWNEPGSYPTHLTCTIHDSIILDIKGSKIDAQNVAHLISVVMERSVTKLLKERYNLELPVPLKVEATCGRDWYNQTEF